MKKSLIPLLVVGTALVTGCNQNSDSNAPVVKKEDAVAVVNGKYIPKSTLDNLEKELSSRGQAQAFPKEKIVEELIQREILVQDALQKHLDQSPEVIQRLEETKKTLLTQANVQDFIKNNPVTDAEIKAEYDKEIGSANNTEYKARHILVKTEGEAKKIIVQLDKGGDFAKLANKHSLDGKESQNGGDLGWFSANQMVEPFSKAVIALEKGKYTHTPVQTQFGWHVILREDSRTQTPPPLDAVKDQLVPFLQRKKVQDMLEQKRKEAKVEILIPLTEEKPADAKPEDGQPAAENVVIDEEVTDANGKTVEEDVTVEEIDEEPEEEQPTTTEEPKKAGEKPAAETPKAANKKK